MSDDFDEDGPPIGGFLGFLGAPPPEVQAALQARRDRHQMAFEDSLRALDRFLKEAPVEHLVVVNRLFVQLARHSEPREYANYLEGTFTTILRFARGVCSNCGENHDDLDHEAKAILSDLPSPDEVPDAVEAEPVGKHEEESE